MIYCITGTNTDVGKTIATAALAAQYQAAGKHVVVAKPLQTGDTSDCATVTRLTGVESRQFKHYPEPLAPNLSARRAGLPQAERGGAGVDSQHRCRRRTRGGRGRPAGSARG